jgi:GT2 family glycosyltransferase
VLHLEGPESLARADVQAAPPVQRRGEEDGPGDRPRVDASGRGRAAGQVDGVVPAVLVQIAVIIPARDAARVLPSTLAALEGAPEVVVVDNGSSDGTAEVAAAAGATVVREPRPSRPRARNAGARATGAPRLAFLDADCVPDPGWLAALHDCLDRHALVGGRVLVAGGGSRIERFDARWRLRQETTIAEGWSGSGNLGIRRELFDRLGGFDESFTHAAEDVDLCLRAGRVAYCAEAVVHHPAARGVRSLVARAYRHGYGSTQLHHRYGTRIGRRDWRHPRPAVAGDWALQRFGISDRDLLWIARLEYAGRIAGSARAELDRLR